MGYFLNEINNRSITSRDLAKDLLGVVDRNYERRANSQVRLDYYNDKQLVYLKQLISNQFKFPERLNLQTEFMNVTRMICDELGSLYIKAPTRKIEDGTDADSELFDDIAEMAQLDSVMDTNNKLVKLCKTTMVRPVWRDETIQYIIYTPNMFDVLENPQDPTKPLAVIYANNYDKEQYRTYDGMTYQTKEKANQFQGTDVVFHVWTADRYFMFNTEILRDGSIQANVLVNEDNPENINPYGTLDIFVPFRDDFAFDGFFVEGGSDLINANELINIKKTELNYLTKMQSFGVPVRKGAPKDAMSFIADPSMTVDLPADDDINRGIDFKFESPDPKINELSDDIQVKLRNIAIKYKLNPEMFTSSGNRSSAESIAMQNYYLSKAINRDKPRYASYEKKLYEATKIVNNMHNSQKLSDNSYLSVNFSDFETPTSLAEQDQHRLLLVANGIRSKAWWRLQEDPDLGTEEEAEQIMQSEETEPEVDNGEAEQ